jgi:transposase-like protein
MSVYLSNRDFFRRFPDDGACLDALMALRFGPKPACPKCGRAGPFARVAGKSAFGCPRCGHHLHPMAGTAFDRSRAPLQSWFYAIYLTVHWRRRVPARVLARRLGLSHPTALRLAREIGRRLEAMNAGDGMSSTVR